MKALETCFTALRRTVDPHRSPVCEATLRDMAGLSTYVKRAAEKEVAPTLASTMYPIPAEVPFWEPLLDTHYVYVPKEGPWVLRLVEAFLYSQKEGKSQRDATPTLDQWLDRWGHELPDSKLRKKVASHAVPDDMHEEDAQFLGIAMLALAATNTLWILWDPFRGRVIRNIYPVDGAEITARWFLRDEQGRVGIVVPYGSRSPTASLDYGRAESESGKRQWMDDQAAYQRLQRMSAQDLKAHCGASGRTKKTDVLKDWYERVRWDRLYPDTTS